MHRALTRTGWTLATLGALGLTRHAAAAPPGDAHPVQQVQLAGSAMRAAEGNELAFLEEIRVELAWLGDPLTFSYGLLARCNGQALEVHGYVPDDLVRQRTLQLARTQTRLPVVDALRLHPYHLSRRVATEAPRDLEQAGRRLLLETCGDQAQEFEVRADGEGNVRIRGTIASYEAKLAVSRALRQLAGCTCALNQLLVRSVERDGRTYAQVLADGQHLLALTPLGGETISLARLPTAVASKPTPAAPANETRTPQRITAAPVPPPVRLASSQEATPVVGHPYMTEGTVTFPYGDPALWRPTAAISTVLLKRRLEMVCWGQARGVDVATEGADKLVIHLQVASDADGTRLSRRILEMPELGPFRVSLQVRVGP